MKKILTQTRDGVAMLGLLTMPHDFDPAKESLPMIVFLHGAGERGYDVDSLARHGIAKHFLADQDYKGVRVLTFSPQCPEGMTWSHVLFRTRDFIEDAINETNADRDRLTVTGMSMGGYGTWDMLETFPGYFAAGAPLCGGGMTWRCSLIGKTPVWAFHGTEDASVPYLNSFYMVERLRRAGGNVKLTTLAGYPHDCWTHTYSETGLVEWLAAARRE